MPDRKELISLLREALNLMVVIALIAFAVNLVHPRGFSLVSRKELALKQIVPISAEEAVIKQGSPAALFIDSREPDEFRSSRIPGAVNLPYYTEFPGKTREMIVRMLPGLGVSKELVIYCGATCGSSRHLAEMLIREGYRRHIYILDKGLPEWAARKYPLQKGNPAGEKE